MRKTIIIAVLLLFAFASLSFAAKPDGKLYILPENSADTIYVDGLLVGQGKVWIEALEEGEYAVQVYNQAGSVIHDEKAKIKGKETTTITISQTAQVAAPPKKGAVEYTPTLTLYMGYHWLGVSGTFSTIGTVSNVGMRNGSLVGLEINKDITQSLELQLGMGSFSGYISSATGAGYVYINHTYLNLRHVWESGSNWFKVNYIGGGFNSSNWYGMGSGSGYQLFYGGYTEPLGYVGTLQTELGLLSTLGGGNSVSGFYVKAGWAF